MYRVTLFFTSFLARYDCSKQLRPCLSPELITIPHADAPLLLRLNVSGSVTLRSISSLQARCRATRPRCWSWTAPRSSPASPSAATCSSSRPTAVVPRSLPSSVSSPVGGPVYAVPLCGRQDVRWPRVVRSETVLASVDCFHWASSEQGVCCHIGLATSCWLTCLGGLLSPELGIISEKSKTSVFTSLSQP